MAGGGKKDTSFLLSSQLPQRVPSVSLLDRLVILSNLIKFPHLDVSTLVGIYLFSPVKDKKLHALTLPSLFFPPFHLISW